MSKTLRLPDCDQQALLDQVQVRMVERTELERFKDLLDEHHYLGSLKAVGERLHGLPPIGRPITAIRCWWSKPSSMSPSSLHPLAE
jgi:hypothetical protein